MKPREDRSLTQRRADVRQGGYVEECEEGVHEREGHGDDPDPADKSRGMEQRQVHRENPADVGADIGSKIFRDEESSYADI